jgi:anti-sigma B factor antagonist
MTIETYKTNNFYIINLNGELDASSALSLDSAIRQALDNQEKKIIVNCADLRYVSSAGLGVFISYLSEFEKDGIYFALMTVKENVLTTLEILGLEKLVNIIDKIPND